METDSLNRCIGNDAQHTCGIAPADIIGVANSTNCDRRRQQDRFGQLFSVQDSLILYKVVKATAHLNKPAQPSVFHKCAKVSGTDKLPSLRVWNRILVRSRGATQVLAMPPAMPPAASSCMHNTAYPCRCPSICCKTLRSKLAQLHFIENTPNRASCPHDAQINSLG